MVDFQERKGVRVAEQGEEVLGAEARLLSMQLKLLRSVFALVTLAAASLLIREIAFGSPPWSSLGAFLAGGSAFCLSYFVQRRAIEVLGFVFYLSFSALITGAAFVLGGANGTALSFAFLPGFLALLTIRPLWGWLTTAFMLLGMAWLYSVSELAPGKDTLRFSDEILMTLFCAGLGHTLTHSFVEYQRVINRRQGILSRLQELRHRFTASIYARLEPLASRLVGSVSSLTPVSDRQEVTSALKQMTENLDEAFELARPDSAEESIEDSDRLIRRRAMRLWLGLGVLMMLGVIVRNLIAGVSVVPSLFAVAFCFLFMWWLNQRASARYLELTAFCIGIAALGPLVGHIQLYGPTPAAPPLVIAPSTVIFAALLSQGRSAWALLVVNLAVMAWVSVGRDLGLFELRLLGNLALVLLNVVLVLRRIFELRGEYIQTLLEQGGSLALELRRRRRLSGTLFHDVRNYIHPLSLVLEEEEELDDADLEYARLVAQRIQSLIETSKTVLLGREEAEDPSSYQPVTVAETLGAIREMFRPKLVAKGLRMTFEGDATLTVQAQRDLLIESVIGNLVSNAIKFSPPSGCVTVRVEQLGTGASIAVLDQGAGVSDSVQDALDGEDALPSSPGTAGEMGHGYGLQVVAEHVRRMSGQFTISPRSSGGTEALVWLPLAAPPRRITADSNRVRFPRADS